MRRYNFEILGSLPSSDAVAGILSAANGDAPERVVLLLPPQEGLTDYKRRERIANAKSEIVQGGLIQYPGTDSLMLSRFFERGAEKEIKASLTHAEHVAPMIDVLYKEAKTPIIVLDAQNRESFWMALRAMGVESEDLFAVAELGALKPEAKTRRVSKPIGEAHLLCADLMGQNVSHSDYEARDLINMIRRATKVKLPDVDMEDQAMGSYFLRELAFNTDDKGVKLARAARELRARLPFTRVNNEEIVIIRRSDKDLGVVSELKRLMQGKGEDDAYVERHHNLPHFMVLRGDPQDVLTRKFRKEYAFDADTFDFDKLVQKMDKYGSDTLQFRDGIHVSPFNVALYETNFTKGEHGHILTHATLVVKEEDGLTAYNFMKPAGAENPYILEDRKMHVALSGLRAGEVSIIDMRDNKLLTSGKKIAFEHYGDMAFMHVLSAIARMNDPDFAPVTYETQRRGVVDAAKGKFPYFDYIGIEGFGPAASHLSIGPEGKVTEALRFHLVRGHPRRLRDEEGNVREIIMIPQHSRGSETEGVVAKGYRLDK